MTWRERLLGLALAGGLVGSCSSGGGSIDGSPFPRCNGVADPCCLYPDSGACFDYHHPEAGMPDAPVRDGEPDQ